MRTRLIVPLRPFLVLLAATSALAGVAGFAAPGGDTLDSIRPKLKAPTKAAPRKPAGRRPNLGKRTPPVAKARPPKKPATPVAARPPVGPTAVPVTAKLPGDTLANGRVAWWPMEGNAKDIVGGNDGTFRRGVSAVPGMVGVGLQFDGNESGILVKDAPVLQFTDSFSISMWLRIEAYPATGRVGQIFFRGDSRAGNDPYNLCVLWDGRLAFQIDSGAGYTTLHAPIPQKVPVHVCAMLDITAQTLRIYVNGKLAAETKAPYRPLRDLDPREFPGIGIGNTQNVDIHQHPFYGLLDDLQVHNRALTPDEVAALARR
jgi:hypothetical protein